MSARWRRVTAAVASFLLSSGCASTQLNYNAVEVSSTFDSIYIRQTLHNLSRFIDDQYAIPSQVLMSGGTVQTTNQINPSLTFPLSAQIAKTAQATPTLLTLSSTNTLAGVGGNVGGSNSATQNYNLNPLSDANTLRNQQALYRHAAFGTPLIGNYRTPQVFFQNTFYDDPYHLQKPHCVLCAVKQGVFSGFQHPAVYENKHLPPKWLYWDNDPKLNELLAQGEPVHLGRYGNHELFMSQADYDRGVLTDFVVFTMPNTEPAEVLTPLPVHLTPGTPGATATRSAPASINNTRMLPASRQTAPATFAPLGVIPAQ